ncbi:MAG: YfhO family protein [Catenulispora sp.]|nr:YfhO family protein [Catenulispora sp.]
MTVAVEEASAGSAGAAQVVPEGSDGPERSRRPRVLTVVAVLGVVLFALWGIGGPLFGTSTLTSTDEMVAQGPWFNAGFADSVATNTFLDDTYTSQLPSEMLFRQELGRGKVAQWNPYGAGGSALGAVPDYALYSPLTVPFYVLPAWLAPAYERLLEIVCCVGGAFLFLRRVSLSRPSALVGGLVFAGSGFMVAWLGFPQTRVAAFIPALFWAVERFIQLRRPRDAALAALPVAAILLGGFPSVAGYALLTASAYALVRLAGEHREDLRKLVRPVLYLGGSLAGGVGVALFQLVPFHSFFTTWMIQGRDQTGSDTLPVSSVLTAVAPFSFGTIDSRDPVQFVLGPNMVEAVSYLGAAAVVLVLVAVAMPRRGRTMLPVGAWVFVAAAAAVWAELIYVGGPPLALAQKLPVLRALFEQNYIGRARSILGFLLAVLVAVGFELLIRARTQQHQALSRRRLWGVTVAVGGVVFAVCTAYHGRNTMRVAAAAGGQDVVAALHQYRTQILGAAGLAVIAGVCALVLFVAQGRLAGTKNVRFVRLAAATTLIVLIAAQGAQFMARYYPHSGKDTFYPVTDTHAFLADNLGEQRYASTWNAVVFGTSTAYNQRSVNGHTFLNAAFAAMLQGVPDGAIPYTTYVNFQPGDLQQATSPVLDRLGTKYWVAGPGDAVFGTVHATPRSGTTQLIPGRPVTVPVTGPLRGVQFTPQGDVPPGIAAVAKDTTVDVVIRDANGNQVAQADRMTGAQAGVPLQIAVAADEVPAGTALTATITLHADAPLTVDANGAVPAIDTLGDADDGLRVVYSGSTVVYERLKALPRIRWASQSTVVASQDQRVALLASGSLPDDAVVLSDPGYVPSGQPARVTVQEDGTDTITTTVDAAGSGYLVVSDADQVGWRASVDGRRADLVKADQGVVAVYVQAGTHTVTLRYDLPQQTTATWASTGVAISLMAVPAGEWWWQRRRSRPVPQAHLEKSNGI